MEMNLRTTLLLFAALTGSACSSCRDLDGEFATIRMSSGSCEYPVEVARTEYVGPVIRSAAAQECLREFGYGKVVGDPEKLPAHCVDADSAVRTLNHMSLREGLLPSYAIEGEGVRSLGGSNGYRLLTSREYAHLLAFDFTASTDALPYCGKANLAGTEQAYLGFGALPCDDGYVNLAPPRSFAADKHGLFDVVGNLNELAWPNEGTFAPWKSFWAGGGSYLDAHRLGGTYPEGLLFVIGFRVARGAPCEAEGP